MSEAAERIGAYELVRLIARGGMATVYEARQPALDRAVALKRLDLRLNDPTLAARFIRESQIAASFDHPNIVTVFDFFEWQAVPYIAMEYLPRGSLRPRIPHVTLPQAFGVLEGVLAALAHAEHFGVAHRDLKPENVLVTARGAVKIADFGIAKAYTASTRGFTETGTAVGTPAYMAPEQALGQRVGPYTDLYAVGVMAYEMLSGAPPFAGTDTPMAVMFRHVNEVPPRLEGVDERLADWVARLLEKAPDARFPGAAEAWRELEDIVVDLLGPYWRRDSMLDGPGAAGAAAAATPAVAPEPSTAPSADAAVAPAETPAVAPEPSIAPSADAAAEPTDWHTYESPPPRSAADSAESVTTDPSAWPDPGPAVREAGDDQGAAEAAGATTGAGVGTAPAAGDRPAPLPPLPPSTGQPAGPPPEVPPASPATVPPAEVAPSSAATVPPVARRGGADGPVERTLVSRVANARPGERTEHRATRRRRRALAAGATLALLGGGVAAALALNPDPPPVTPTPTPTATSTAAPRGARAFDFDGDGSPAVVAGLPGWRAAGAGSDETGAVALPGTSRLLAGADLDPPVEGAFGAAVASGDFDRDGHADMAVGAPRTDAGDAEGREGAVTIVPGSSRGLVADRAVTRAGPGVSGPFRDARYGAALAAGDLDRDGFADLAIGVPGARSQAGRPGSGALRVIFGGPGGLQEDRTRTIVRPDQAMDGFGALLRSGDVNRDGNIDLVEAAPGDPANGIPGHANYCPGRRDGPIRCRPLAGIVDAGPASLAIGDLTGDGFPEIVAGMPTAGAGEGAVSVWLGRPSGPAGVPLLITQESPGVVGNSQSEDRFGEAVAVAHVDADRAADLIVSAPGEDGGQGRVSVLMGGPEGYDPARVDAFGSSYAALPVEDWEGAEFGAAVTAVDTGGDGRPSLSVAVPGTGQVITLPNTGTGFTADGAAAKDLGEFSGDGELPGGSPILLR